MKRAKNLKRLEKRLKFLAKSWTEAMDWKDTPFESAGINDALAQVYLELANEIKRVRKGY